MKLIGTGEANDKTGDGAGYYPVGDRNLSNALRFPV
jgi:hypothetical protein